jgi:vacuolar-type H+-ATPase subunit I/STV1
MEKKPDLVVWNEKNGYDAKLKSYPTSASAQKFDLPNVPLFRSESSKKMMDVFNREQQEIRERIEKLYDEYNTSIMVWESKISFEPIVGKSYFLYNFAGELTLSLIAPNEWARGKDFIGEYLLNSDNKWVTQK